MGSFSRIEKVDGDRSSYELYVSWSAFLIMTGMVRRISLECCSGIAALIMLLSHFSIVFHSWEITRNLKIPNFDYRIGSTRTRLGMSRSNYNSVKMKSGQRRSSTCSSISNGSLDLLVTFEFNLFWHGISSEERESRESMGA